MSFVKGNPHISQQIMISLQTYPKLNIGDTCYLYGTQLSKTYQ